MLLSLIILTILVFAVFSWVRFMKDRRKVKIPGPVPIPFLGNGHLLAVSAPRFVEVLGELGEQYGSACLVYILSDRYVLLRHPKYIEIKRYMLSGPRPTMECQFSETAIQNWNLTKHKVKLASANIRTNKEIACKAVRSSQYSAGTVLQTTWTQEFFVTVEHLLDFYGSAVCVYVLSHRYVMLAHPKYIEPIISSTEFITKGISYYYLKPWLGEGLLTSGGNRWRTHRKFLTPAFHFNILQNFLPVFCKNTKVFAKKLEKLADGKTDIDLFPITALVALDNVTESIMGVCVDAQKNSESQYVKAIEDLSNLVSTRMRNPFFGEDVIFNLLPHKGRQDKALKVLHGQTMKVIEARREELKKLNITELNYNSEFGIKNKHAFLDLLLLAEIDGNKIDAEKVREEVDTFMFEGHDTTTSGIVFAMFCLSKRQDIQEKVLDELQSIFGDDTERDPTYTELSQMKYLETVIKESLRLYPSVPFIERMITRDTDIAGLHLPKDTSVVFNFFHMQRLPEVYEDPLEFRPERFTDAKESKNAFSWLAFSAGPRNCIGQKFAMMELKVTLSTVIRNFKILPSEKEPILIADLILRSKNGVHVKLVKRN